MNYLNQMYHYVAQSSWILQVFLIILATAFLHAIEVITYKKLKPRTEKTKNIWDDALLYALHKPAGILIWVMGVTLAAEIIREVTTQNLFLFEATNTIRELSFTLLLVWAAVRFIQNIETAMIEHANQKGNYDKTSINAIAQILRVSVIITGGLVALSTLGIPLSGVLAFGGFGGIAVGFAAKDSLANLFGGLMIYLDKPFKVGDWIRSPDKEIEGTVEYIGWRLTRIRTFDKRPLYVPNGVFSNISVENPSRMTNRRIKATVGVRYDDANKIAGIVEQVEKMLLQHSAIDTTQTCFVRLVNFGASALEFLVYTFTKTTNWVEFQAIQEDIFLKILAIIDQHGAECAFPTTTIHLPDELRISQQSLALSHKQTKRETHDNTSAYQRSV